MKNLFRNILLSLAAVSTVIPASAQYYEIANQIPQLITPALMGGFNYKGFVEGKYVMGVGQNRVDFLGVSTSQGFKYATWFFMGAGIGVDVAFSHVNDNDLISSGNYPQDYHNAVSTGVMIPIFTDFRFNIGQPKNTSFFAGVKLGCSFLVGNDYLKVNNGYLSSQQYFYFRPSLGVRIPLSKLGSNNNNGKKALNIGLTYQLLTSNYWNAYYSNVTVNSLGLDVSYEW